jgi:hypothetical protein
MVAVDLMRKIEEFIGKMDEWKTRYPGARSSGLTASFHGIWLGVLGIIAYFKLPLHKDSDRLDGNGGCWVVLTPSS